MKGEGGEPHADDVTVPEVMPARRLHNLHKFKGFLQIRAVRRGKRAFCLYPFERLAQEVRVHDGQLPHLSTAELFGAFVAGDPVAPAPQAGVVTAPKARQPIEYRKQRLLQCVVHGLTRNPASDVAVKFRANLAEKIVRQMLPNASVCLRSVLLNQLKQSIHLAPSA
jgi:hypothetical protein